MGQARPWARTFDGSTQVPKGTDTSPTCSRSTSLQKRVDQGAETTTLAVDLQSGECIHRATAAPGGHAVVALRRSKSQVAHQLLENVEVRPAIGMTLGVGVAEGVGEDELSGKRDDRALGIVVGTVQGGQRGDPVMHDVSEQLRA